MNLFSRFTLVVSILGVIAVIGMESMTFLLWRISFFQFLQQVETAIGITLPANFPQLINTIVFNELSKLMLFQIIFTVVLLILWVFYFRYAFFRPVKELTRATQEITNGNLQYLIPVKSKDEIGQLSKDFNNMTIKLKTSYDHLEDLVKERTHELDVKIKELEQVNQLMVDRELKMKELKLRIAELEKMLHL